MTIASWSVDDEITAARLNEMVDAANAMANVSGGTFTVPVTITEGTADTYDLTIQHTLSGATGNKLLKIKNDAGSTAFEIGSLGSGGYSTLIGTWVNTDVGPLVVSNVRNWNTNSDFTLAITKLTGNPTGSHPITELTYQTCHQPSDGFGGSTNVPDQNVLNVAYFAANTAFGASQNHDGSGRGADLQVLVFANTGQRTMAGLLVGTHSAVSKTSYTDRFLATGSNVGYTTENGDCGIIIRNDTQSYTGFGSMVTSNTALLTAGLGWKQHIACRDTSDNTMFAVDSAGIAWAKGFYPIPGASATVGTSARTLTSAFVSTFAAGNGSAANPSVAMLGTGNYADGLFGVAGGSVVGVGIAGTEKGRWDASGLAVKAAMRFEGSTAVITPTQLTSNTDNWNPTGLSTARILRVSSDASRNLTGIVAQTGGTVLSLVNVGSQNVVLKHEVTSTAANRFNLPGAVDLTLGTLEAVEIYYDSTASRWLCLSGAQ